MWQCKCSVNQKSALTLVIISSDMIRSWLALCYSSFHSHACPHFSILCNFWGVHVMFLTTRSSNHECKQEKYCCILQLNFHFFSRVSEVMLLQIFSRLKSLNRLGNHDSPLKFMSIKVHSAFCTSKHGYSWRLTVAAQPLEVFIVENKSITNLYSPFPSFEMDAHPYTAMICDWIVTWYRPQVGKYLCGVDKERNLSVIPFCTYSFRPM